MFSTSSYSEFRAEEASWSGGETSRDLTPNNHGLDERTSTDKIIKGKIWHHYICRMNLLNVTLQLITLIIKSAGHTQLIKTETCYFFGGADRSVYDKA